MDVFLQRLRVLLRVLLHLLNRSVRSHVESVYLLAMPSAHNDMARDQQPLEMPSASVSTVAKRRNGRTVGQVQLQQCQDRNAEEGASTNPKNVHAVAVGEAIASGAECRRASDENEDEPPQGRKESLPAAEPQRHGGNSADHSSSLDTVHAQAESESGSFPYKPGYACGSDNHSQDDPHKQCVNGEGAGDQCAGTEGRDTARPGDGHSDGKLVGSSGSSGREMRDRGHEEDASRQSPRAHCLDAAVASARASGGGIPSVNQVYQTHGSTAGEEPSPLGGSAAVERREPELNQESDGWQVITPHRLSSPVSPASPPQSSSPLPHTHTPADTPALHPPVLAKTHAAAAALDANQEDDSDLPVSQVSTAVSVVEQLISRLASDVPQALQKRDHVIVEMRGSLMEQLLDMRAMVQQLNADKLHAQEALEAARAAARQQQEQLALVQEQLAVVRSSTRQQNPADTSKGMSDPLSETLLPLETTLLDIELTISAAKSEATPSRAGLAASEALKEERYKSAKLEQQVESLLAQSAAKDARVAAAMVEARGLHVKCEEMMTERRREKVSSDARIQTLSSRLEFLEHECDGLEEQLRVGQNACTCFAGVNRPPPPSPPRTRSMSPVVLFGAKDYGVNDCGANGSSANDRKLSANEANDRAGGSSREAADQGAADRDITDNDDTQQHAKRGKGTDTPERSVHASSGDGAVPLEPPLSLSLANMWTPAGAGNGHDHEPAHATASGSDHGKAGERAEDDFSAKHLETSCAEGSQGAASPWPPSGQVAARPAKQDDAGAGESRTAVVRGESSPAEIAGRWATAYDPESGAMCYQRCAALAFSMLLQLPACAALSLTRHS